MPRGVKGSGKPKKAAKTAKTRKPYPTHEERLIAVDTDIERLTKLNEERVELVKKTEEKLAERKIALQRSEDMLLKAQAKREKIISVMNRPKKEPVVKLTPEERAAKRKSRWRRRARSKRLNAKNSTHCLPRSRRAARA